MYGVCMCAYARAHASAHSYVRVQIQKKNLEAVPAPPPAPLQSRGDRGARGSYERRGAGEKKLAAALPICADGEEEKAAWGRR
jgi:hypothetical protein